MSVYGADLPVYESDDDWIRAGRLAEKARAGDKEAEAELERMNKAEMVPMKPEDEP